MPISTVKKQTLLIAVGLLFTGMQSQLHAAGLFESLANFFNALATSTEDRAEPEYSLTRKQMESYLDFYIRSLDYAIRPNINSIELKKIRSDVDQAIRNSSNIYIWVHGIRFYNKDRIDQFILSALLEMIEKNSYNYAYDQEHNHRLAQKISESMRNNALACIQQSKLLDPEQLKPFFGYDLKETIRKELNRFDVPFQHDYETSEQSSPLYPSDSCCICFDDFSYAKERVFLKPCGHDMCQLCALEWFFPGNLPDTTKTCPLCRSWVNIEKLYEDLEI